MFTHDDPPEHARNDVYLTADEIKQLIDFWVPRLGLQAWNIEFKVLPWVDMPMDGTQGTCSYSYPLRRATVSLLDPRDHRPGGDRHLQYDMETTLVHELLHVALAAWSHHSEFHDVKSLTYIDCVEHPVEQLSIALVALRRATETKRNRMGAWR